jgi:hypothetical protein
MNQWQTVPQFDQATIYENIFGEPQLSDAFHQTKSSKSSNRRVSETADLEAWMRDH